METFKPSKLVYSPWQYNLVLELGLLMSEKCYIYTFYFPVITQKQYSLPGLNSRINLWLGFSLKERNIVIEFFRQSIIQRFLNTVRGPL